MTSKTETYPKTDAIPTGENADTVVLHDAVGQELSIVAQDPAAMIGQHNEIFAKLTDDNNYEKYVVEQGAFNITYDGGTTHGLVMDLSMPDDLFSQVLLLDYDSEGQFVGHGSLMRTRRSMGLSFVGDTETWPEYQRQGWGLRRLRLMNKVSQLMYGDVLHSDPEGMTELEAQAVWEKLVASGEAIRRESTRGVRWQFKQTTE